MFTVRNLKTTPLGLKNGVIQPGQTGLAERAEVETLFNYLEVITNEKEETETHSWTDEPRPETLLKKRGRKPNV